MLEEAGPHRSESSSHDAGDPLAAQVYSHSANRIDPKSPRTRALVISFQRSGLNWLRHCAEFFGDIRTPGRPQLIREGPVLFDRAHDVRRSTKRSDFAGLYAEGGREIYSRVALLLRNPYDCFSSHYL